MTLKTILLTLTDEVTSMYTQIEESIDGLLGEQLAVEFVCIDNILWDYVYYFTTEPHKIDLEEIDELELLPEYQDKEQELIMQLFYNIYLYAYFMCQNKDRLIQEYKHYAQNFFWKAFGMIYWDKVELSECFYDTYLWLNGTEYLFERSFICGFNEFKELMFTEKGHNKLERGGSFPICWR